MGRRKGIHTTEFSDRRCAPAAHVHFGGVAWVTAILHGVSPAVIALIIHCCRHLAMAEWQRVPRRRSRRHAEPWAGSYRVHLRGLPRYRLLGITSVDNRNFLSIASSDLGRRADPLAASRQPKWPRLRHGAYARAIDMIVGACVPPGRIAHCTYSRRRSRGLVPLE
jgi:hypothetical protein